MLRRSALAFIALTLAFVVLLACEILGVGERVRNKLKPSLCVVGDSISLGYTPYLRRELEPWLRVVHTARNERSSSHGLKNIEGILSDCSGSRWVLFNFGLHDLANPRDGRVRAVAPEEYKQNISSITRRLKAAGFKLFFLSISPVPPTPREFRRLGDDTLYNSIAKSVMEEEGVRFLDIHTNAQSLSALQLPHTVHYTQVGYMALGLEVAELLKPLLRNGFHWHERFLALHDL